MPDMPPPWGSFFALPFIPPAPHAPDEDQFQITRDAEQIRQQIIDEIDALIWALGADAGQIAGKINGSIERRLQTQENSMSSIMNLTILAKQNEAIVAGQPVPTPQDIIAENPSIQSATVEIPSNEPAVTFDDLGDNPFYVNTAQRSSLSVPAAAPLTELTTLPGGLGDTLGNATDIVTDTVPTSPSDLPSVPSSVTPPVACTVANELIYAYEGEYTTVKYAYGPETQAGDWGTPVKNLTDGAEVAYAYHNQENRWPGVCQYALDPAYQQRFPNPFKKVDLVLPGFYPYRIAGGLTDERAYCGQQTNFYTGNFLQAFYDASGKEAWSCWLLCNTSSTTVYMRPPMEQVTTPFATRELAEQWMNKNWGCPAKKFWKVVCIDDCFTVKKSICAETVKKPKCTATRLVFGPFDTKAKCDEFTPSESDLLQSSCDSEQAQQNVQSAPVVCPPATPTDQQRNAIRGTYWLSDCGFSEFERSASRHAPESVIASALDSGNWLDALTGIGSYPQTTGS